VLAATRVQAPADCEVMVQGPRDSPPEGRRPRFGYRVWLNDAVVYDSRADAKAKPKPCRLRQGGNTLVVECRSTVAGAVTPGDVGLKFLDAKKATPVDTLLFDTEKQ